MDFGIKNENNKNFCKSCGKELKIEVPNNIYNFCPFCCAPLNLVAFNYLKEKNKNQKIALLNELLNSTKNYTIAQEIKVFLNKLL